jgi:hypothetical protein
MNSPNMLPGETDADFCRRMGYGPGTRLAGDEGSGIAAIRLTAIGEKTILAIVEFCAGRDIDGFESTWTLRYRDWKPV